MKNHKSSTPKWIIVDWGTTNFRAFLMSESNQCIDKIESKTGLLNVENREFERTLQKNLESWDLLNNPYPIFMAGMIGSKQGWHEADYITTPLSPEKLSKSCLHFATQWGSMVRIVPGVSHQVDANKVDVMRGEEVQILGLVELGYSKDCLVILPGTHSKHACLKNGRVTFFSTFMTGEFYSLLSENSLLGRNLQQQTQSLDAFTQGVKEGAEGNLLNTAFMARTHRLFGHLQETEVHDYLSGIVIGKEVNDISTTCYIIGNTKLAHRYNLACETLGKSAKTVDGDSCFIAGMASIREQILYEAV